MNLLKEEAAQQKKEDETDAAGKYYLLYSLKVEGENLKFVPKLISRIMNSVSN